MEEFELALEATLESIAVSPEPLAYADAVIMFNARLNDDGVTGIPARNMTEALERLARVTCS